MKHRFAVLLLPVLAGLLIARIAPAQRHSFGSAPPTVPPPLPQPAPPPVAEPYSASSGMGPIQFVQGSGDVPAPQTLVRQLSADDEHTRMGALAAIGAPRQYLAHGHVPFPHSAQLDLVQLGNKNELDALLTVEFDQHVVSAVLVPANSLWRRVATLSAASSFNSGSTVPASFVRPLRSWLEPDRYQATFHASTTASNGDFTENEAVLRVLHGHATVVLSFVSGMRQCEPIAQPRSPQRSCEFLQRWFTPDPADPFHHFVLITGVGHVPAHEAADPLVQSPIYRLARLKTFSCQPFVFAEATERFEPTAPSAPCATHEAGTPASPHPASGPPEHLPSASEHPAPEHR